MTVEEFFEIFLIELKDNPDLQDYYKFLGNSSSFDFRKAYFTQRLQYIANQIHEKDSAIWDCGCGFGTTCLFLAMNGYKTFGSTLEFYFKQIDKRKEFWSKYGDSSLFTASYENIFDNFPQKESLDYIILQDTLHHLEPIDDALKIFKTSLKNNGKMILIEENGNNLIQNTKLYLKRGNKKVISIWDEKLQKNILLGNENIRSLNKWNNIFKKHNFSILQTSIQYIRFYFPQFYNNNIPEIIDKEQRLWNKNKFLKEYFFFGLNFVVIKNNK